MTDFSNYSNTQTQTDFDPPNQSADDTFANNNSSTMSDNQTIGTQVQDNQMVSNSNLQTSQGQAKGKPSKQTINDFVKSKKSLHSRIKKAYLKRIAEDIDKGRKSNVDINKFIFDLLEMGLSEYEK